MQLTIFSGCMYSSPLPIAIGTPSLLSQRRGWRHCISISSPSLREQRGGIKGGEYVWLKGENKGVSSWKFYWDKQLNFKYIKISTAQDVALYPEFVFQFIQISYILPIISFFGPTTDIFCSAILPVLILLKNSGKN